MQDGYLVDFLSVETTLKFIQQGIVYDELPEEEKEIYEDTFEDPNGELPESIASSCRRVLPPPRSTSGSSTRTRSARC